MFADLNKRQLNHFYTTTSKLTLWWNTLFKQKCKSLYIHDKSILSKTARNYLVLWGFFFLSIILVLYVNLYLFHWYHCDSINESTFSDTIKFKISIFLLWTPTVGVDINCLQVMIQRIGFHCICDFCTIQ